jgi:hypothetical protein
MANAQPIGIETLPNDYPVTSTGWGGIRDAKPPVKLREHTIPELVSNYGMSVIPWDGWYISLFLSYSISHAV